MSVDHFYSQLKRRTYNSFGSITSGQFLGVCIFVGHMSGYINVDRQLGFLSSEIIQAKKTMKNMLGLWYYG